jgi:hypothetical protein
MWKADVTSSQRSPGFGAINALEKIAFSEVVRDFVSNVMREAMMPIRVKKRSAMLASLPLL